MTSPVRNVPGRDPGFSLIELMIALVVISIGILGLSAVQTRSSGDVHASGRQSGALALAQERIEIARFAGYADAVSDSGVTGPYRWTARVDSVAGAFALRDVNVTVNWTEQGVPRSLLLQTLLSRR